MIGLYSVIWGKSEEIKARGEHGNEQNLTRHLLSNQDTLNKEHEAPIIDIAWEIYSNEKKKKYIKLNYMELCFILLKYCIFYGWRNGF